MSDTKGCFSLKGCVSRAKEAAPQGQNKGLSVSESVNSQEAPMERVRTDDLSQVAGRSEIRTSTADKDVGQDHLLDKKGMDSVEAAMADNAENTQPNERGSTRLPSAESSAAETELVAPSANSRKIPFTSLSQVDSDMVLARTLQEQETAYMLLRRGSESSDFESSGSGSYGEEDEDDYEEDDGEEQGEGESPSEWPGSRNLEEEGVREDLDGALFDDDEAFARALQDREDRETTAMLAGIHVQGLHDWENAEYESESDTSQDMWQEMDPDNMSYEELVALGEAVGTQTRGLAPEVFATLPTSSFVPDKNCSNTETEQCAICRNEYEEGDVMSTLPCKHHYHAECIQQWFEINKVCPQCNKEVTAVNQDTKPETASS